MNDNAYFISPSGEILSVPRHHIVRIYDNPELFGTTRKRLDTLYEQFDESPPCEGQARNEIVLKVLKKGWVRVRYYSESDTFNCQVYKLTEKVKKNVEKFRKLVKSGEIKPKFSSRFSSVIVFDTNLATLERFDNE